MRSILFFFTFGMAGAAILIGLGVWQVQRLGWKQDIIAQIEARVADAPVPLPVRPDPETDKYLAVTAEGFMGAEALRVLVSRKQVGAGYRIISPFVMDGRTVLLDRGFIRVSDELPPRNVSAAVQQTVIGNLHWPQETDKYTPSPDLDENIWFARDVDAMAEILNTEPTMIVLREGSVSDAPVTPFPVDTAGIPNDHLQYAITWFSLAFIWLTMTAYFLTRGRRAKPD